VIVEELGLQGKREPGYTVAGPPVCTGLAGRTGTVGVNSPFRVRFFFDVPADGKIELSFG